MMERHADGAILHTSGEEQLRHCGTGNRMFEPPICPIWRTPARLAQYGRLGWVVDSPRAGGKYSITDGALLMLQRFDGHLMARLTSWLIEQRRLGDPCPAIDSEQLNLVEQARDLSVHKRADNLLRYILTKTPHIGRIFALEKDRSLIEDPEGGPVARRFWEMLAWSESLEMEELEYLLDYLVSEVWLERDRGGATCPCYSLTVRGYGYLDQIDRAIPNSAQAFVAMWFHESMDPVWSEGIRPAISDAGYEPVRIDQRDHLNKIDDQIITEIRRSQFIVADFTHGGEGARGGVYYEAGFAHGLGLPVIFTCQADALDTVHFDTRQYPHIVWQSPDELRGRLSRRISAVLGDGPLKNQN